MKTIFMAIIAVFSVLISSSCTYAVRYDGEYSGRVIDANTGTPIEGAVVLGVWSTEFRGAGGAAHKFYDAKETVTDKNGEFSISGQGIEIMSNVTPMDVFIFKAGYEHLGYMEWDSLKEDEILRTKIKWEGSRAIVPLRKLTKEEIKKYGPPSRPSLVPDEKMRRLTEEINKERIEIGVTPFK